MTAWPVAGIFVPKTNKIFTEGLYTDALKSNRVYNKSQAFKAFNHNLEYLKNNTTHYMSIMKHVETSDTLSGTQYAYRKVKTNTDAPKNIVNPVITNIEDRYKTDNIFCCLTETIYVIGYDLVIQKLAGVE